MVRRISSLSHPLDRRVVPFWTPQSRAEPPDSGIASHPRRLCACGVAIPRDVSASCTIRSSSAAHEELLATEFQSASAIPIGNHCRVRPECGRDCARSAGRLGRGAARVHDQLVYVAGAGGTRAPAQPGVEQAWRPTAPTSRRSRCSRNFAPPMTKASSSRGSRIGPNWMKSKRRLAAVCSNKRESAIRPSMMSPKRLLGGAAMQTRGPPPSRPSTIERHRKSAATNHVPAAAAGNTKSVAAVESPARR